MPIPIGRLSVRNKEAISEATPLLDQLSANWAAIETALSSEGILQPCETVYQEIFDDRHEPAVGGHQIGVRKLSGSWRICHSVINFVHPDEETTWTPVVDLPIPKRIELLDHVDKLRTAIVKSNRECVKELQLATEKSKAIYDRLTSE